MENVTNKVAVSPSRPLIGCAALSILHGDANEQLRLLPSESVNCVVTSPPYFNQRDYGASGQIGTEATFDEYKQNLVAVFRQVFRVLRADGTLWLNLGDKYKNKNLLLVPAQIALALQADGWILRQDIIWNKPDCMPEPVRNRPTKSHEYLFLITKTSNYFFDAEAIKEPKQCWRPRGTKTRIKHDASRADKVTLLEYGNKDFESGTRNKRSVWTIPTNNNMASTHFAVFPEKLVEPCVLAGCPTGGVVLDPFAGSGTTGAVALKHGRSAILIELNKDYVEIIKQRCSNLQQKLIA